MCRREDAKLYTCRNFTILISGTNEQFFLGSNFLVGYKNILHKQMYVLITPYPKLHNTNSPINHSIQNRANQYYQPLWPAATLKLYTLLLFHSILCFPSAVSLNCKKKTGYPSFLLISKDNHHESSTFSHHHNDPKNHQHNCSNNHSPIFFLFSS